MPDTNLPDIARLSARDRLKLVIERTLPKLPSGVAQQLKALLEPEALAVALAIVVLWAGLHFTGIGEVADVILICTAWVTMGAVAWQAGKELIAFARGVNGGRSDADLDDAADHLARAIGLIGVQAVLTLLLHTAPKPYAPMGQGTARLVGFWPGTTVSRRQMVLPAGDQDRPAIRTQERHRRRDERMGRRQNLFRAVAFRSASDAVS
jgi:hypothetical protein